MPQCSDSCECAVLLWSVLFIVLDIYYYEICLLTHKTPRAEKHALRKYVNNASFIYSSGNWHKLLAYTVVFYGLYFLLSFHLNLAEKVS